MKNKDSVIKSECYFNELNYNLTYFLEEKLLKQNDLLKILTDLTKLFDIFRSHFKHIDYIKKSFNSSDIDQDIKIKYIISLEKLSESISLFGTKLYNYNQNNEITNYKFVMNIDSSKYEETYFDLDEILLKYFNEILLNQTDLLTILTDLTNLFNAFTSYFTNIKYINKIGEYKELFNSDTFDQDIKKKYIISLKELSKSISSFYDLSK